MSNPYQPPDRDPVSTSEVELATEAARTRSFAQEMVAAAGLATAAGILVALLLLNLDGSPWIIFGAPAAGWLATFVLYLRTVRRSKRPFPAVLLTAGLLSIPAYLIYIPACTVGSMFTTPLLGSEGYGPKPAGIIVGSVAAFLMIMLIAASIIRARNPGS